MVRSDRRIGGGALTRSQLSREDLAPGVRYKRAFKTVNQAEFELKESSEQAGFKQLLSSKSAEKILFARRLLTPSGFAFPRSAKP